MSGMTAWRSTMSDRLTRVLGYKMSALDPCLFVLYRENSPTVAVDDTLPAGKADLDAKMTQLQ